MNFGIDISILSNLNSLAIFAPLVFELYLLFARLNLSFVNKKVLNNGSIGINLISLLIFSLSFYFYGGEVLNCSFDFFKCEKFLLNFGLIINEENILYLIFTSLVSLIVSLYAKVYFARKKQFMFTKQRFYIFLSFLSFFTYLFLASNNLFQATFTLILSSIVVLIFTYFDPELENYFSLF